MSTNLDNFYLSHDEPNKSCLLALRDILLNTGNFENVWRYRLPCFMYKGFTLAYLWVDKKSGHPYVSIWCNNTFDHPKLIAGNRKVYKLFIVDPNEDIDIKTLHELLSLSIKHRG